MNDLEEVYADALVTRDAVINKYEKVLAIHGFIENENAVKAQGESTV